MSFQDHFSRAAGDYARFRPKYPPEFFQFLASIAPGRALAWDCGTGSGQAAIHLAQHFERVVATDASEEQLSLAPPHRGVEYRCESAVSVSLPDHSADLVTAAAAVHWFPLDDFYAEVRRVGRPGGIVAAWAYHLPVITPPVDEVIADYSSRILLGHWPAGSSYVLDRYASLPFPFLPIAAPDFAIELELTLEQLAGFLGSWSAANAFRAEKGIDPVDLVRARLTSAFGTGGTLPVRCPLFLRVGSLG